MVCLTSLKDVRKVDESCTSIRFLCLIFLVLCPIFVDKCNYRKEIKSIEYHICYNVNNSFFYIMGASIISILENNKNLNLVFHIFTDGYSE